MKVVKYKGIVAGYYQTLNKNPKGLIVVAVGAPSLFDVDSLRNSELLMNAGYDIIVPEYYGFCRSEKIFSPSNSIKTLLVTKKIFMDGKIINVYENKYIKVKYTNIIFLGLSYGGSVVPLLAKFDNTIDTIGLFYPLLDYKSLGTRGVKEETVQDFLGALNFGFKNVYRGIEQSVWKKHFNDSLGFTPSKNINLLKNKNIFLAQGTDDISIYYKKTQEYYKKISESVVCKIYKGNSHGIETMLPATKDFIKRINKLP